jgi:microcystin-dependent protein
VNRQVLLDNRLSTLTNAHNYVGDLHIERNATIGGNLDVSGDLTVGRDLRARSYYATGNYYLNNYVLIPAGTIIQSAAINEPAGWLDCDGRTLLVAEYAYLFSAIGYGYGGANLSFNIPDMRGRVGVGLGDGPNTDTYLTPRNLGAKGGAETHTLTTPEMPAHNHGGFTGNGGDERESENVSNIGSGATVSGSNEHRHSIAIDGSGNAHNNMQPFLVIRYLIKY